MIFSLCYDKRASDVGWMAQWLPFCAKLSAATTTIVVVVSAYPHVCTHTHSRNALCVDSFDVQSSIFSVQQNILCSLARSLARFVELCMNFIRGTHNKFAPSLMRLGYTLNPSNKYIIFVSLDFRRGATVDSFSSFFRWKGTRWEKNKQTIKYGWQLTHRHTWLFGKKEEKRKKEDSR